MLKIVVVANTFQEAKRYAEFKFRDRIESAKLTTSTYTLKNGDTVYLAYDERSRDQLKSMEFDAFVVHPQYESLLDVVRRRCERG